MASRFAEWPLRQCQRAAAPTTPGHARGAATPPRRRPHREIPAASCVPQFERQNPSTFAGRLRRFALQQNRSVDDRDGSKTDQERLSHRVRSTSISRHRSRRPAGPVSAKPGHWQAIRSPRRRARVTLAARRPCRALVSASTGAAPAADLLQQAGGSAYRQRFVSAGKRRAMAGGPERTGAPHIVASANRYFTAKT